MITGCIQDFFMIKCSLLSIKLIQVTHIYYKSEFHYAD